MNMIIALCKKIDIRRLFAKRYNRGAEAPQKQKDYNDLRKRPLFCFYLCANRYNYRVVLFGTTVFIIYFSICLFSKQLDFELFKCGFTTFLKKENPYNISSYGACLFHNNQHIEAHLGFLYPPTIFGLLFPLAIFPEDWWFLIWTIVRSTAAALSVVMLHSLISKKRQSLRYIDSGFASVVFLPILFSLAIGQLVPLFLFALVILLVTRVTKGESAKLVSGLALSLFIIKPNLFWLAGSLLFIEAVGARNISLICGVALGSVCLFIAPYLYLPSIYSDFLAGSSAYTMKWYTPTLPTFLHVRCGLSTQFSILVSVILALLIALKVVGRDMLIHKSLTNRSVVLLTAVGLFFAPYAWTYDYAILLPGVFMIIGAISTDRRLWFLMGVAALFLLRMSFGATPMMVDILVPIVIGCLLYSSFQKFLPISMRQKF